ncbi:hypothetical protein BKA93DRAFT_461964 [Sparassis latifolia]
MLAGPVGAAVGFAPPQAVTVTYWVETTVTTDAPLAPERDGVSDGDGKPAEEPAALLLTAGVVDAEGTAVENPPAPLDGKMEAEEKAELGTDDGSPVENPPSAVEDGDREAAEDGLEKMLAPALKEAEEETEAWRFPSRGAARIRQHGRMWRVSVTDTHRLHRRLHRIRRGHPALELRTRGMQGSTRSEQM